MKWTDYADADVNDWGLEISVKVSKQHIKLREMLEVLRNLIRWEAFFYPL